MSTPTETAPCGGYQILDAEGGKVCRVHCNGCAALRERVGELRTELESHANQEAAWKLQVDGLRERLEAAERRNAAIATLQAENAELQARVDNATTLHAWETKNLRAEAEARATADEGELAEVRKERDDYRAKAWTRFELVQAAEGERDRLRELLERCANGSFLVSCRALAEAQKYLAAIPHTEGEASAPPKETSR